MVGFLCHNPVVRKADLAAGRKQCPRELFGTLGSVRQMSSDGYMATCVRAQCHARVTCAKARLMHH